MQSPVHTNHFHLVAIVLIAIMGITACVHDPVIPDGMVTNPPDTTLNPPDTNNMHFCDPDTMYFERDILPILISNCAISGCHDPASAEDGVILNNFNNVVSTGKVKAFKPGDSELYEVITESDPGKRMPPPPAAALSQEQILSIAVWINQGAQNLYCIDSVSCDTTNVSFSATVSPIIQTYCVGCHNATLASGGIQLANHTQVAAVASSGMLYGAIAHQPGYSAMPQGGAKLDNCKISQIKKWIDDGTPNN
jgi:hypothetical protein